MPFVTFLKRSFKKKVARNRIFYPVELQLQATDNEDNVLEFQPDQVVCFIREELFQKKLRPVALYVIRTQQPSQAVSLIEGVYPGAKILLQVTGPKRIAETIRLILYLAEKSVAIEKLDDSVWSSIHSRNEANISLDFFAERLIEDSKS